MLPTNLKQRLMSVLAIVVILFGAVYINRAAMRLGSPITFDTVKEAVLGAQPNAVASNATYKTAADGVVEVPLTIRNTKFEPAALQIPAGKAVRLVVDRKESSACSDQLSMPQLGITKSLKANGITTVDIPATSAGKFTLTCGMGMMSGSLTVGAPQVSSSGSPSPMPWLVFTLGTVGAAIWLARRPAATAGAVAAPAHAQAKWGSGSSGAAKRRPSNSRNAAGKHSAGRSGHRGAGAFARAGTSTAATAIAGFTRRQIVVGAGLISIAIVFGLALGRGVVS